MTLVNIFFKFRENYESTFLDVNYFQFAVMHENVLFLSPIKAKVFFKVTQSEFQLFEGVDCSFHKSQNQQK